MKNSLDTLGLEHALVKIPQGPIFKRKFLRCVSYKCKSAPSHPYPVGGAWDHGRSMRGRSDDNVSLMSQKAQIPNTSSDFMISD